ncbi:polymerase [Limosilactobacillus avium]|uniref:polymerase n=1 Tax=Limosilactobacillus avium TaxID=2991831 RepID=UPI0024B8F814|nr:polymerase [Limosilactobacillus avium]
MKKDNFWTKIWDYPINGRQVYLIAFLFYFLPTLLSETTFIPIISSHWLRIFTYISLPLLLFKIFVLDQWRKKELLVISIFLIFGLIVWRTARYSDLLIIFPFIIGAKNVNFRDIIRWYFYVTVFFIMTVMIFSLVKIIPNLVYYSKMRPTRYSLGMLYPSVLAAHYLFLALAYCYLKFGRLNIVDYLLITIGDFICMWLTNTRLDFLATLIIIPVMVIAQRAYQGKRLSNIIASFWWMATPISATIIIFLSYFYNSSNHFLYKVNTLLSSRLELGRQAFKRYDLNLLGRSIVEHSFAGVKGQKLEKLASGGMQNNYFYIDSSYIRLILLWGLLAFVIVIICLTFIAIRSTVRKTFILSAIILVSSLSFMFEPHIVQIIYNPFLLALLSNSYFSSLNKENKNAR